MQIQPKPEYPGASTNIENNTVDQIAAKKLQIKIHCYLYELDMIRKEKQKSILMNKMLQTIIDTNDVGTYIYRHVQLNFYEINRTIIYP